MSSAGVQIEETSDATLVREIMTAMSLADMEDEMDVPKLVVCGDQSAGKSSVLEVQAMLAFPKAEETCTLWATVVVMRPPFTSPRPGSVDLSAGLSPDGTGLHATIMPSPTRDAAEQASLKAWSMTCRDKSGFKKIMAEAGKVLKGEHGGLICKDRLMVIVYSQVPGAFGFVDMPGLVRDAVAPMTLVDKKRIDDMVAEEMKNPRTLILTVIQAGDLSLSEVSRMAKEADPNGERTIGVLTKPDTIDRSPAIRKKNFELLLHPKDNNQRSLPLGWFVTKNRDAMEQDLTEAQRAQAEKEWFSKGDWADIPDEVKGAEALGQGIARAVLMILCSMLDDLTPDIKATITTMHSELEQLRKGIAQGGNVREHFAEQVLAAAGKVTDMLRKHKKEIRAPIEAAIKEARVLLDSRAQAYDFDRRTLLSSHDTRTQQESTDLVPVLDQRQSLHDLLRLAESYLPERCIGLPDESTVDQYAGNLFAQLSCHWHNVIDHLASQITVVLLNMLEQLLRSTLSSDHASAVVQLIRPPAQKQFIEALKGALPGPVLMNKGAVDDQEEAMLLAYRQQFLDDVAELQRHATLKNRNDFPDMKKLVARQLVSVAQVMYFASVDRYMRDVTASEMCGSMIVMVGSSLEAISAHIPEETLIKAFGLSEQAKNEALWREQQLEHAQFALRGLIELKRRIS